MTIGELARKSGLSVRTLRFYADAGVLPEAGRSKAGYRLFDNDAVPRARLIRTLRDLGVGLGDVKRVVGGEASLADVASAHARALDTQIRALRLQRAVLAAVAGTTNPKELERMNDLTSMTSEQRRRLLDDYLDAVFDGDPSPVAERIRMGAPELPDDPTVDQIAAWVEIAELLRDPEFVAVSRRMAERARLDGAGPDGGQVPVDGVAEHAGAATRCSRRLLVAHSHGRLAQAPLLTHVSGLLSRGCVTTKRTPRLIRTMPMIRLGRRGSERNRAPKSTPRAGTK